MLVHGRSQCCFSCQCCRLNLVVQRQPSQRVLLVDIYFAISGNVCIFAPTFESESCKQEKHCDILSLKVRQINEGGLSINCFRLNVYAVFI